MWYVIDCVTTASITKTSQFWGDDDAAPKRKRKAPTRRGRRRGRGGEEDEDGKMAAKAVAAAAAEAGMHACDECGKTYKYLGSLNKHMQVRIGFKLQKDKLDMTFLPLSSPSTTRSSPARTGRRWSTTPWEGYGSRSTFVNTVES